METGEEGEEYTIFSDSRSALQALKRNITRSPLVIDIKELIHRIQSKNISLDMCWVPGHVNISGNERADKAAKGAAASSPDPIGAIPHTDMKRPVREAILRKWREDWNSMDREGEKLREIKQEVCNWKSAQNSSRRIETALSRLRVGHTNITHSYLMQSQANPPECDVCRELLTVKHLLLKCRKYAPIRNKHFTRPSLSDMLAEGENFDIDKITRFLKDTGLLAKI